MSWKTLALGDFCKTGSGGTPSRKNSAYYDGGTIPWIKSGELRENIIFDTEEHVTDLAIKKTSVKLVPKGAILLAMYGATVGRMAVLGVEATTNQAICHIIPDEKIAGKGYLYHCLQYKVPEFLSKAIGGAQPNINQQIVKQIKIPLPPRAEQQRIAAILDKADALRAKRRAALAKLDTLLQATFLEMFGDPVTNPMGWEVKPLEDICGKKGSYGSGASAISYESGMPRYIRITDIKDDGSLNDDWVSPSTDETDWEKNELIDGDIVFARSGATVGKTYLHREENGYCVYAGYLIKFHPNPSVMRSEFLFSYTQTSSYEAWVKSRQKVVAQPNINAKQYGQELLIPVPPLELQDDFVRRVNEIRAKRKFLEQHLKQLDNLFQALQQRAFKGEL